MICAVIMGLYFFFIFPDFETHHHSNTITALPATNRCQQLLDTDSDCSTEQPQTHLFGLTEAKGPNIETKIKNVTFINRRVLGSRGFWIQVPLIIMNWYDDGFRKRPSVTITSIRSSSMGNSISLQPERTVLICWVTCTELVQQESPSSWKCDKLLV